MLEGLRARLTYGNVVATLALFLALGGGMAFALATNSVKSRHIKNGQVKSVDLRDGAVTNAKLGNGAVTETKLGDGSVSGEKVADGEITGAKLANGTVTLGKLNTNAYSSTVADAGLADGLPGCTTVGLPPNQWIDQSPNVNNPGGWIFEPSGVVHLQGVVRRCGTASETIFVMPEFVRPAKLIHLATMTENGALQQVTVDSAGQVAAPGAPVNVGIFLDGLTFRAAG